MSEKLSLFQSVVIPLSNIELNTGQIPGVPRNPRKRDNAQLELLKKSILDDPEMLGLRDILVYQTGDKYVVIGGNMRLEALRELKYTEAICRVIPDGMSAAKLRAIAIKDNNSFGQWDYDLLGTEWATDPLDQWGLDMAPMQSGEEEKKTADNAKEDDYTGEVPKEANSRPGDIYRLGDHRLICGDSTDAKVIGALMEDEKADLWLTDPPYNVAVKNSQGMTIANDNLSGDEFAIFLTDAFKAAEQFMAKGCPFYVWFASCEHINFEQSLNRAGLRCRQELIWNKNHFILGRAHYQWKHEPCLYGWKGDTCKYFTESRCQASVIPDEMELDFAKMKKADMQKLLLAIYAEKVPTTVIDEDKPLKDADHPTMKPIRLFARLIENSSREGDLILDTFGGSGTTLLAAEQMGRKCYMVELDPIYVDVIIKRWEDLTGKKAELIHREN